MKSKTRSKRPQFLAVARRFVKDHFKLFRKKLKALRRSVKLARRSLWGEVENLHYRRNLKRRYAEAHRGVAIGDAAYDRYVYEQLEETLRKKKLLGERRLGVIELIDMLGSKLDLKGQRVLCVGCRNTDEMRYFRKRGAGEVVGVDLFSDHPDITLMDMHDLKFPEDRFNVVYSRHSFEHAYDKAKAAREFVRVLKDGGVVVIEVPGRYKGGGDYNWFEEIDDVTDVFRPELAEFLWREYSKKEDNPHKVDIIRVMFRIDKAAKATAAA